MFSLEASGSAIISPNALYESAEGNEPELVADLIVVADSNAKLPVPEQERREEEQQTFEGFAAKARVWLNSSEMRKQVSGGHLVSLVALQDSWRACHPYCLMRLLETIFVGCEPSLHSNQLQTY